MINYLHAWTCELLEYVVCQVLYDWSKFRQFAGSNYK